MALKIGLKSVGEHRYYSVNPPIVFWAAARPINANQVCPCVSFFFSSYSDRVLWVRIFVFLVTKQLQLVLWDFNLMNFIDLCIDLCWGLARRLNDVFWHWKIVHNCRRVARVQCCIDIMVSSYPLVSLVFSLNVKIVSSLWNELPCDVPLTSFVKQWTKSKKSTGQRLKLKPRLNKASMISQNMHLNNICNFTYLHFKMLSEHLYVPRSTTEKIQPAEAAARAAKSLAQQHHS